MSMAPNVSKELTLFEGLCSELSDENVAALREQVTAHVARLEAERRRNELIAVDLAVLVRERLERLFELGPALKPEERAMVVGAARYFVSRDDAIPDTKACTGLDDDVMVVNYVLTALGRSEWRIEE
jgi:uncharacterized membrane protein YkvA (DUF1232 family)